jgi:hypothetical protein
MARAINSTEDLTTEEIIENFTWYCTDCSSCGEWGCCPYDCEKCRTSEDHMWDTRVETNKPKKPVEHKSYKSYEEMYHE